MNKLLGVVLCGGASRRMGRDKGLIEREGVPWAIRMGEKLTPWSLPVVYSINAKQQAAYTAILSPAQLITDTLELPGPLNGLFSVHERYPDHDLLLLACDMPDLDDKALRKIIDLYLGGRGGEGAPAFYVYRDAHFLQPFCAIYTAAGLRPMHLLIRTGGLQDTSLQALLKSGSSRQTVITDFASFHNYNTPE